MASSIIAKKTVLPTPKDPNNKLGTRSFVWMGPIDLSNYTIQGDVLLKKDEASGKISDVGLINGRYQLTIRGLSRKLRLDTWTTSDYRTHTAVDFEPEPDTWYTMKLRVVPSEDRGQGAKARSGGAARPSPRTGPSRWSTIRPISTAPPASTATAPRPRSSSTT